MARGKKKDEPRGKKKDKGEKPPKKSKKSTKKPPKKRGKQKNKKPGPPKKIDFSQERQKTDFPDVLRFTPYAFAKMLYLRDKGSTEISGFALTDDGDPYLIVDFIMPEQECTGATTEMTSKGIVDLFDKLSGPAKFGGMGISPGRYGRVWIHTHPGFSSEPSGTDWATFREVFGDKDWAIMFIMGKGKEATCILRIEQVAGGHFRIPWEVDWDYEFPGSNFEAWDKEYDDKVTAHTYVTRSWYGGGGSLYGGGAQYGKCEVCEKGGVYRYTVGNKKMCWACKEARKSCRGKLKTDQADKYAKWNELMGGPEEEEKEDTSEKLTTCTKCGKEAATLTWWGNNRYCDDCWTDDADATEDPSECARCGAKDHLLAFWAGQWLCQDCEDELQGLTDGDTVDAAFIGEAIDAVDAANIAADPGGFLADDTESKEEDDSGFCDKCNAKVEVLVLHKISTSLFEYLCEACYEKEDAMKKVKEEEKEVFGAESSGFEGDTTIEPRRGQWPVGFDGELPVF